MEHLDQREMLHRMSSTLLHPRVAAPRHSAAYEAAIGYNAHADVHRVAKPVVRNGREPPFPIDRPPDSFSPSAAVDSALGLVWEDPGP